MKFVSWMHEYNNELQTCECVSVDTLTVDIPTCVCGVLHTKRLLHCWGTAVPGTGPWCGRFLRTSYDIY